MRKGDVLSVARVAGIMAIKRTSDIIPLCHPHIGVTGCRVRVELVSGVEKEQQAVPTEPPEEYESQVQNKQDIHSKFEDRVNTFLTSPMGTHGGVRISATVECEGKTGVEMEALAGTLGAALTVIDMCKGVDTGLIIEGARVTEKQGGRSGGWRGEGFR